ncbi:MAG TPA: APC family permease [Rhodanobacteraceae bacterium]|nr:APC family permease [Rhodanobacteraceae bacterium]
MTTSETTSRGSQSFHRTLGLFPATAVNMSQMCGIGPFITIPLIVAAMGGPQAVVGWVAGAVLAIADGLVWAELGAALPGAGGTYLYLREAFGSRSGKLMPFLFVWTAMLFIPLVMSTGVVGLVQYLGYFFPGMSWPLQHFLDIVITGLVIILLYRRIESIRWITTGLWIVMLASLAMVIFASFSHFHADYAFTYPKDAWSGNKLFVGLGAGLVLAAYDYMGYGTSAYIGDELRDPGRVIPRSIIYAIVAMMLLYLALQIGVLGTVPWQTIAHSDSIGSLVVRQNWGVVAADTATGLILVAAFASVYTGLLGGSRVPYYAARDQVFFPVFGRLHKRHGFPHVALLAMGVITAAATFFDLGEIINMLVAAAVIVQSLAQIAALVLLRRDRPNMPRPYRQWLYPVPCIVAAVGWIYLYWSASGLSQILSGAWIVAGLIAFLVWAKINAAWPFRAHEPVRDA